MPLDARQFGILKDLVAIPSWFQAEGVSNRTSPGECNEKEIIGFIKYWLGANTDSRVTEWGIGDGTDRSILIAERGAANPQLTILVSGHVDTVAPADVKNYANRLKLIRNGEFLHGLGAYDMKAGIMAMMHVMESVEIPAGVKVIAAFLPDEEQNSAGANRLIKWPGMKEVDLAISPEIVTLTRGELDNPKDIILARAGNVKTVLEMNGPQAHSYNPGATDLADEYEIARRALKKLPQRKHLYYGDKPEFLREEDSVKDKGSGLSVCVRASGRFVQFILPGGSIAEAIEKQGECLERIAAARDWTARGVQHALARNDMRAHYEPYMVDIKDPRTDAILKDVARFYGGVKKKSGFSTSDGNVIAPHLLSLPKKAPYIEFGPVGVGAHETREAVHEESVVRYIQWLKGVFGGKLSDLLTYQTAT